MNRYFKEIITQSQGGASLFQAQDGDAADDLDDQDLPALMAVVGVNSGTDRHAVVFPSLTRWNSSAYTPDFHAMLGAGACAQFGTAADIGPVRCVSTHSPVTVGTFTYHTDRKERLQQNQSQSEQHTSSRSRYCVRSWFAIRAEDVPNLVHKPLLVDGDDVYVYGRFKKFISLHMTEWDKTFQLAECQLFTAKRHLPITKQFVIHPGRQIRHKFIPLNKVVGPVVLGPQLDWHVPSPIQAVGAGRQPKYKTPEATGYLVVLSVLEI